jgi:hypothetical protein
MRPFKTIPRMGEGIKENDRRHEFNYGLFDILQEFL